MELNARSTSTYLWDDMQVASDHPSLAMDHKIDVEIESWQLDITSENFKKHITEDKNFLYANALGFTGRSGVYVAPKPWIEEQRGQSRYPEYYRSYGDALLIAEYPEIKAVDVGNGKSKIKGYADDVLADFHTGKLGTETKVLQHLHLIHILST